MVRILLNCVHVTSSGNFEGFLETIFYFLPNCFRLNRHNYARDLSYLSYYYVHMRSMKKDNREASMNVHDGGLSESLTGREHSSLPFDQVTETLINRSCKDVYELSQITQNEPRK